MTSDSSMETTKARRVWSNAFLPLPTDHDTKPELTYSAKLSKIFEEERKTFHYINILKNYIKTNKTNTKQTT